MPDHDPSAPTSLPRRLLLSLGLAALAGLLLMAGQWGLRLAVFPAPTQGPGGLTSQRFAGARLAGPPGPAQLERRTAMSDVSDADFRQHDFSLRLSGFLRVSVPGRYVLALESDDDGRLFIDGEKVIDNSGEHPPRLAQTTLWLGPGRHYYEVEYAQRTGGASLRLLWAAPWGGLAQLSPGRLIPAAQPLSRERAGALGFRLHMAALPLAALIMWGLALGLARAWRGRERGLLHLALAGLLLVLAMWANSGTLAPLAATQNKPFVWPGLGDCSYLGSIDHQHFEATHWMLSGDEPWKWTFSLVLRRILQPLIAYPFIKAWGFMEGGFLANVAIHLAMLFSWWFYLRRRVGERGALWGLYGLALYPGLYYWSSLPYSYAFLAPASVWAFMALWELGRVEGLGRMLLCCAALGMLFLGYDIWPFFLPAAPLLIWWRTRRLTWAALSLPPMILPTAAMIVILSLLGAYSAPVEQGHEPLAVFRSFFGQIDYAHWWRLVKETPWVLWLTYFFGNYLFLPVLFLLLLAVGWRGDKTGRGPLRPAPADVCLLLAMLGVFLFNNLAPPYKGWQFRGEMYVRFYQPLFTVMLFFLARVTQALPARSWVIWPSLAALVLSAWVTYGPALGLPEGGHLHWRFGHDGAMGMFDKNLDRYGRWPLGLCPPCQPEAAPPTPAPPAPRPQGG